MKLKLTLEGKSISVSFNSVNKLQEILNSAELEIIKGPVSSVYRCFPSHEIKKDKSSGEISISFNPNDH